MRLLLRRSLSFAASSRLGRPLSTAASRSPWAMIHNLGELVRSPARRASFQLAEPPSASHLTVPEHLVDPRPEPDPNGDIVSLRGGGVRGASGDGLLLLDYLDARATAPIVGGHGAYQERLLVGVHLDPDMTRFVCNPVSGQLFRLPDIDGTKKTPYYQIQGILTQSERPDGPPDKYAVAWLSDGRHGVEGTILMRRFLSQRGEWDKLVGLPSPLPLERRMDVDHEVVAFAGRLWWVDVSWGAVSLDPFSDRPELRFVELPRGSVTEPKPVVGLEALSGLEGLRVLGRYRRMGVSEGRMRYVEVSQKKPFVLSSFTLDDDGSCWTLEYRVALNKLLADGGHPVLQEDTPRIGVIDPLNASIIYLTIGYHCIPVDMATGRVLGQSLIHCTSRSRPMICVTGFLIPSVLPAWLESGLIPSAGTSLNKKANAKSKTLSDILVRVDTDKKIGMT
ncbi:unnamed protein product [Urochloa humidicola]